MIDLALEAHVGWLTLTHPARRNAMTRSMWRQLRSVLEGLPAGLRCLVLRGHGGHFSAGGDITEYPDFRFDQAQLQHFHEEEVAPALDALLRLDHPVIAQIEGNCMGGGLEIAACCDIRIAGQGATFGAPIARLGMPMAPRELAIVVRAAGEASVREMLLEARLLDARTMHQRGFLQTVVADDAVAAEVTARVHKLIALSPQAARLNKQILRGFFHNFSNPARINSACSAIQTGAIAAAYAYANTPEHREGVGAFLGKRPPKF